MNFHFLEERNEWSPESMTTDSIIDMWEMAHVKDAATLLDNLGFTTKEIDISKLLAVIDEELQDVHTEKEFTPLLRVGFLLFSKMRVLFLKFFFFLLLPIGIAGFT